MQEVICGYLSNGVKVTKLADHSTAATSDVTSAELDMAGFTGVMFITSFGTANSGNLVTMHDCDTSGGSFAATVALKTSGASDEDVVLDVKKPAKRFVKLVATRGASSTLESIWAIQYGARNRAQTNALTGTIAVGQFSSPAAA